MVLNGMDEGENCFGQVHLALSLYCIAHTTVFPGPCEYEWYFNESARYLDQVIYNVKVQIGVQKMNLSLQNTCNTNSVLLVTDNGNNISCLDLRFSLP
jgi:hypothetical protein